MTTRNIHFSSIILIASIILHTFTSCGSAPKEDVKLAAEEVILSKEHYDESKEDLKEEIENYKIETADKVDMNDKRLSDFKVKAANDKTKATAENQKQMDILVEKNAALKRRVNAFVAGDKANWEAFKQKCSEDMQSLDGDICNACGPQY